MDKEPVIPDALAKQLVERKHQLSRHERSLLRVWCFHNNPPTTLTIIVDNEYRFGFSESGERLGLVDFWGCPEEDCLYFDGDNGILYIGKQVPGYTLRFEATVLDYSVKEIQKRKKETLDLLGPG